jgi:hypothetical protein
LLNDFSWLAPALVEARPVTAEKHQLMLLRMTEKDLTIGATGPVPREHQYRSIATRRRALTISLGKDSLHQNSYTFDNAQ